MDLPTKEQCLALFEEYKVPKHILKHCQQVQKVAGFLCQKLEKKGTCLNLEMVEKAALLHDMMKVVVLNELDPKYSQNYSKEEIQMWQYLRKKFPEMNESEVIYLLLKDNYPELALLIKNFADHQRTNQSWEEMVLLYADARVLRNKIVSLKERMDYIKKIYSPMIPNFDAFYSKIKKYERVIIEKTDLKSESLAEELKK